MNFLAVIVFLVLGILVNASGTSTEDNTYLVFVDDFRDDSDYLDHVCETHFDDKGQPITNRTMIKEVKNVFGTKLELKDGSPPKQIGSCDLFKLNYDDSSPAVLTTSCTLLECKSSNKKSRSAHVIHRDMSCRDTTVILCDDDVDLCKASPIDPNIKVRYGIEDKTLFKYIEYKPAMKLVSADEANVDGFKLTKRYTNWERYNSLPSMEDDRYGYGGDCYCGICRGRRWYFDGYGFSSYDRYYDNDITEEKVPDPVEIFEDKTEEKVPIFSALDSIFLGEVDDEPKAMKAKQQ